MWMFSTVLYCECMFMEGYNLILKHPLCNKRELQRFFINCVAWTLDSNDSCWVDRKTSPPLIIAAFRGRRWGHLEAGSLRGSKWENHQFRQHGQILLLKHCWSDLIRGSLHCEPVMSPGMSPELTPHPDEDETALMKDEQNFIPVIGNNSSRGSIGLLCTETYTLTYSVYKEQMLTSLESQW